MEERRCAGCAEPLMLNPRSESTHAWCRKAECQRARNAAAQRVRRAEQGQAGKGERRKRAAYMRRYRAEHPTYRAEEAAVRQRRRVAAAQAVAVSAVTEAGLSERVQALYVEAGFRRLHVVTEAGSVATVALEGSFELSGVEARGGPVPG